MKQVEVMEKILLALGNKDVEKEQETFLLKYEKIAEKINSIEELTEYKEKEVLTAIKNAKKDSNHSFCYFSTYQNIRCKRKCGSPAGTSGL